MSQVEAALKPSDLIGTLDPTSADIPSQPTLRVPAGGTDSSVGVAPGDVEPVRIDSAAALLGQQRRLSVDVRPGARADLSRVRDVDAHIYADGRKVKTVTLTRVGSKKMQATLDKYNAYLRALTPESAEELCGKLVDTVGEREQAIERRKAVDTAVRQSGVLNNVHGPIMGMRALGTAALNVTRNSGLLPAVLKAGGGFFIAAVALAELGRAKLAWDNGDGVLKAGYHGTKAIATLLLPTVFPLTVPALLAVDAVEWLVQRRKTTAAGMAPVEADVAVGKANRKLRRATRSFKKELESGVAPKK